MKTVIDSSKNIRVIADVHGMFDEFKRIADEALTDNRIVVSLGDLEDRGPDSGKCVGYMAELVKSGDGHIVMSNHAWKHYRFQLGNNVKLKEEQLKTVADFEKHNVVNAFMEMMKDSPWFINYGDNYFAHAAYHHYTEGEVETYPTKKVKFLQQHLIYGETTGEQTPEGFPERLLNWVGDVPEGRNVVVGHHVLSKSKVLNFNVGKGSTMFLDLGCGKFNETPAYADYDNGVLSFVSNPVEYSDKPWEYGAWTK